MTTQLPANNDDAPDIGLITPTDRFWMNVLAGATIVMLVAGWVYMEARYPVRLRQQTGRFAPDPISSGPLPATIKGRGTTFDQPADTLVINAEIANLGGSTLTVKRYIMAMTTWVNGPHEELASAGPSDYAGRLEVEPSTPIPPGETRKVTLKMKSGVFDEERMIPLHDPHQLIAAWTAGPIGSNL